MSRRTTPLGTTPPYAVEEALRRLGANLRTARLRRNLTIPDVAKKIGAGQRAVADAEKGRPGTGGAVYVALLWAYDLLSQMGEVADPKRDIEGLALLSQRERARTSGKGPISNEF
jgi:transcriptional regulator with XRE-family HTH domain